MLGQPFTVYKAFFMYVLLTIATVLYGCYCFCFQMRKQAQIGDVTEVTKGQSRASEHSLEPTPSILSSARPARGRESALD